MHAGEEGHAVARTAWMDNIKTWSTGLPAEESIRMTEDRDKWRKYVHGVANRRIEDGYRAEQGCTAHPLIEHSNSRFESILFVMRIDSFCKKNQPFDSLVVMQFLH